jgi:hypothetical protein
VNARSLPEDAFHSAGRIEWNGPLVRLDIREQTEEFSPGALIEIESISVTCPDEVQRRSGSAATVQIERSLGRTTASSVQEPWG